MVSRAPGRIIIAVFHDLELIRALFKDGAALHF